MIRAVLSTVGWVILQVIVLGCAMVGYFLWARINPTPILPVDTNSTSELVFAGGTFQVPRLRLMETCQKFKDDPTLLTAPYRVSSAVSLDSFRLFVDAIGGANIEISNSTVRDLLLLSREFGFAQVAAQARQVRALDVSAQRIKKLKKMGQQQNECVTKLEASFSALEAKLKNVVSGGVRLEFSTLLLTSTQF
jgi:hypothetical protein